MSRPELLGKFKALRLYGMASACEEVIDAALHEHLGPEAMLLALLKTEATGHQRSARSGTR